MRSNSVAAPLNDVDQARSHIKTLLEQSEADKFAILLRPDSDASEEQLKMIGFVGTKSKTELTYTIHSEYGNKGYMTEALNAFVGLEGFYWDLPGKLLIHPTYLMLLSSSSYCDVKLMLMLLDEERRHIQTLKCQVDPDNVTSLKLVQRIGAREGERRVKAYPLYRDRGPDGRIAREKFRDLVVWWIDRPGVKWRSAASSGNIS